MEYAVNCSIMFKELPVLERAKAAADAGFKAVEFWWPWDVAVPEREDIDAFVASIRDAGVQLIGLNFFAGDMPGGERGLVSLPSRVDDFRANVPVAVEIGRELGCKAFNALYGLRQDGVDAAAPPSDVVGDEGPGDRQIGIGVEAQRELVGVVVEVALDGEASAVEGILASLGRAAESRVELRGAPV